MSTSQCSKCGCSYSHRQQTSCPSCTSCARAYRIATERYSFDSSIYGPPGNPQAYHQISIEICREPNQRTYVSRRSNSLVPVVIDDALVIDGNSAASFNGVLNPALPLDGRSIQFWARTRLAMSLRCFPQELQVTISNASIPIVQLQVTRNCG